MTVVSSNSIGWTSSTGCTAYGTWEISFFLREVFSLGAFSLGVFSLGTLGAFPLGTRLLGMSFCPWRTTCSTQSTLISTD